MNPEQQTPDPAQLHNPISAIQEGEQVLCEIKRHPIGIIYVYVGLIGMLLAAAIVLFVIAPSAFGSGRSDITGLSTAIFFILAVFALVFAFIANYIYWGNRWIVTSDSITQLEQISLFNKHASQLSLRNAEDISSIKKGILQHMFNYGSIKAETPNERTRFLFTYCPDPDKHAQLIINAHEQLTMQGNQSGH
jgi:hypothetical protein